MSFQTLQQSFKMFKERVKRPESLGVYLGDVGERHYKAHTSQGAERIPASASSLHHNTQVFPTGLSVNRKSPTLARQVQGQVVIMKGHRLKCTNTFAGPSSSPGKPHPHKHSCSSVADLVTCLSTLFFFK